jgi:hypothetical protein
MILILTQKKRLIEKMLLLIREMSSLLMTGHDDEGWVGFALDPPLQTMGGPSIMVGSFRINAFFIVTS